MPYTNINAGTPTYVHVSEYIHAHLPPPHTRGVVDCMNYVMTKVGGPEMLKLNRSPVGFKVQQCLETREPGGEKHKTGFVAPTRLQVYATVLPD